MPLGRNWPITWYSILTKTKRLRIHFICEYSTAVYEVRLPSRYKWDFKQPRFVVSYRRFGDNLSGPIFKVQAIQSLHLDYLTPEDETDKLSRNRR